MPKNVILDEMLHEVVKRIQHFKVTFVFDLDQTSSKISPQIFDDPTKVAKRVQHLSQQLL